MGERQEDEEQVAVKHGRRLTVKGNASGRHCLHAASQTDRQTDTTVAMHRRIGLDACICMYVRVAEVCVAMTDGARSDKPPRLAARTN